MVIRAVCWLCQHPRHHHHPLFSLRVFHIWLDIYRAELQSNGGCLFHPLPIFLTSFLPSLLFFLSLDPVCLLCRIGEAKSAAKKGEATTHTPFCHADMGRYLSELDSSCIWTHVCNFMRFRNPLWPVNVFLLALWGRVTVEVISARNAVKFLDWMHAHDCRFSIAPERRKGKTANGAFFRHRN